MKTDFPSRVELYPRGGWTATGSTFARTNATVLGMGYISQSTGPSASDTISWPVFLKRGTWKLTLVSRKGPADGIATVKLDGTSVGTIDLYAAGNTYNVVSTVTNIFVENSGVHTLLLAMAGRTGSNYYAAIQHLTLQRTGP